MSTRRVIYWGVVFVPCPEHGCWYEEGVGDRIGGWIMPMFVNGSPDYANLGEIEVLYDEA